MSTNLYLGSLVGLIVAMAALGAMGCTQSEAATPRGVTAETVVPQEAKAKVSTDTYDLAIQGSGTYKAGQEGTVEVVLVPKGDYHINDKYPIKFKLVDPAPEGITFPKAVLKREDGKIEASKGVFKVAFVASKAGKSKIAGALSFSVCSEKNCLMEKQELETVVDVQ